MRNFFTIAIWLNVHYLISQNAFPLNSFHSTTKEALEIHVRNEAGQKSFLKTHLSKGQIYLVSVWATWCGPCRSELQALQKVHCEWSDKYDFEFIAISVDAPTDHPKIFKMANTMGWDFKVIHDEYGYLVRELDISKIPRMFLVDQKGNIVYEPNGFSTQHLKKIEDRLKTM